MIALNWRDMPIQRLWPDRCNPKNNDDNVYCEGLFAVHDSIAAHICQHGRLVVWELNGEHNELLDLHPTEGTAMTLAAKTITAALAGT